MTNHLMLPTSIDTVVFDHDGTLVDSIPIVLAATNEVLTQRGLAPATPDKIIDGMIHSTAIRLGLLTGIKDIQEMFFMAQRYRHLALKHANQAHLYPGILDMLEAITNRGRSQAVVSNSEGAFIRSILTRTGAAPHFRIMIGEDDMIAPKPDPRGLLDSLGGISPARAAYVGDSSTDLSTARAAGMKAIGVTWGTHTRAEMEALNFDALVDSPLELAALF